METFMVSTELIETITTVRESLKKNPFALTNHIHYEISNRCNLASWHSNCPVGPVYQAERIAAGGRLKYDDYLSSGIHLPIDAIKKSLDDLGRYGFKGNINYHRYNDPLIDTKKIKELVAYSHSACPNANILIYTNALVLDQGLARELVDLGATSFIISAYNDKMEQKSSELYLDLKEFGKNKKLQTKTLNFKSHEDDDKWGNSALDDRLTLYERAERGEVITSPYGPCKAPLNDITVSCTGDFVICCLDWQDRYYFGNILEHQLSTLVQSDTVIELYAELSQDIRRLSICQACGWSR